MPLSPFAQLNVITSVSFEAAYNELVPVFQKSSGITVSTKHFASQGSGPDTIAAQLRAGVAADAVIMSKEGLGELLAEGRRFSVRSARVDHTCGAACRVIRRAVRTAHRHIVRCGRPKADREHRFECRIGEHPL